MRAPRACTCKGRGGRVYLRCLAANQMLDKAPLTRNLHKLNWLLRILMSERSFVPRAITKTPRYTFRYKVFFFKIYMRHQELGKKIRKMLGPLHFPGFFFNN